MKEKEDQENIKNPEKILLIRLQKDPKKSGDNNYYAAFDETGENINIQFKFGDNKEDEILSSERSFNEQRLIELGFNNILSMKDVDERDYLKGKKLRVYKKCHCLIPTGIMESEDKCDKTSCIQADDTLIFKQ